MLPWLMILLQAGLAAAALHQLRWYVLPNLLRLPQRELILDVWGPIAIVLPLLLTAGWVVHSVRGDGWVALGAPAVCGMMAVAAALWFSADQHSKSAEVRAPVLAGVIAAFAGVLLLLLGANHVMHIWIGQMAFAIAAVVLWVNAPAVQHGEAVGAEQARCWLGMILAVLCAAGMGAAALFVSDEMRLLSAIVMLVYAAVALVMVAMVSAPWAAARMGLWAAGLGVLGGLGALSIMRMLPQVVRFAFGGEPADVSFVAYGFGAYAFEAAILLALPLMALAARPLPGTGRVALACALFAGAAAISLWRLLAM